MLSIVRLLLSGVKSTSATLDLQREVDVFLDAWQKGKPRARRAAPAGRIPHPGALPCAVHGHTSLAQALEDTHPTHQRTWPSQPACS
jgi:hypothetical protein